MSKLLQTPSQTVGPFFAYGLTPTQYAYDFPSLFTPVLAQPHAKGEHIVITGQVIDGAGNTIHDAIVEISQADADGQFARTPAEVATSGFTGFGRCGTGTFAKHHYVFNTVKPGVGAPGQAPYVTVCITARGMLVHNFTRIYFDDEAAANAQDEVLASVPAERRATLIAKREVTGAGVVYRFDIRMQGDKETVFFDL
ncbi:protocatechuate 3,4-dioxygenase subunit alpha [Polaromonas sp. SM01]|uniref:protocatechuate 3,4-dioxygenase subunit alpha n=1 Tax=Polaromonas sp. SM01 TaxID=3085630 RepID=UPI002980EA86|nr:protocatechuate 3,4-dioxygenase subunit alpha [Polaromonas sp. SM01]MDW5442440.1 protocatechuate 3,4-dioxygenase subunit alpha [Polaromonas sp. SM01]